MPAEQPQTAEPPASAPPRPRPVRVFVEAVGKGTIDFVEDVGGITMMGARVLFSGLRPPWRLGLIFSQMDFLGVGSTFLVTLTGLFTGMVFATQVASAFALFSAESMVGPTVVLALTRELAPVFTALMVTMRVGSAMCTELGTMRVTEQIDALVTLAVDPVKYLVYPRVVAGILMSPVLCMLFDAAGIFGTWFVAVYLGDLSPGSFFSQTGYYVDPGDLFQGLIKSAVFGLIITLVACFKGFNASGGAKGVGKATTEAMVMSAVAIFLFDYLMGMLLI